MAAILLIAACDKEKPVENGICDQWHSTSLSSDGDIMTLTTLDESAQESVFKRESIPAEIKDGSIVIVKSGSL